MKRLLWIGLGLAALLVLSVGVASADPGDRALSLGARGADVVQLQQSLTALGYPVPATGYYGTMTRRAVAALQSDIGLPVTGKADGPTIQAIREQIAELEALPVGDDEGGFLPPYGERTGPYAAPWAPYRGETDSPYGPGAYGWGSPMGPGMMGGGWGSGGNWGSGMMGGTRGVNRFGW